MKYKREFEAWLKENYKFRNDIDVITSLIVNVNTGLYVKDWVRAAYDTYERIYDTEINVLKEENKYYEAMLKNYKKLVIDYDKIIELKNLTISDLEESVNILKKLLQLEERK